MSAQKTRYFYVTKWCLSRGVFRIMGALDSNGEYVNQILDEKDAAEPGRVPLFLKLNKDVFESAAHAYNRAIKVAEAREKALRTQLARVAEQRRKWEGR